MSVGMGMAAGEEGALGAPEPTHIHVHIHQEPTLSLGSCLRPPAPETPGGRRLLVASWVVQIVAGLLSVVLGVHGNIILCYNVPFYLMFIWEAGIWAGVVAVLAGVTVFIYEKRGGTFWAVLRTLFALAAFATTIAAIYTGACSFMDVLYTYRDEYCGVPNSWEPTLPPTSPEEAHRQQLCLSYLYMLRLLLMGLQIMLLSFWVLLILVSLLPLALCCWRICQPKKEGDQKTLLEASET